MTFGNLEGGSGGTSKQILEAKPPIFPTFPSIAPQDSQVSLSTPGLFHTLDVYTLPNTKVPFNRFFSSLSEGVPGGLGEGHGEG